LTFFHNLKNKRKEKSSFLSPQISHYRTNNAYRSSNGGKQFLSAGTQAFNGLDNAKKGLIPEVRFEFAEMRDNSCRDDPDLPASL
jgi:hypothetical protein